jgi:hypothetical protein
LNQPEVASDGCFSSFRYFKPLDVARLRAAVLLLPLVEGHLTNLKILYDVFGHTTPSCIPMALVTWPSIYQMFALSQNSKIILIIVYIFQGEYKSLESNESLYKEFNDDQTYGGHVGVVKRIKALNFRIKTILLNRKLRLKS